MIKVVFLMRRKAGMSMEAFDDYWLNRHTKLIKRHAKALRIVRYVQSHIVAPELTLAFRSEWDDSAPWDGVAEVWLDSLDVFKGSFGVPEMDAIQAELMADENTFVDRDRSALFITEEHVIIG